MLELHQIPASGDCTLLRSIIDEEEKIILIDGGNRIINCIEYLRRKNISKIDLLIASHLDEDHIRGLRKVVELLPVEELWITDVSPLVQAAISLNSSYMLKCIFENQSLIGYIPLRNRKTVYEGYSTKIGHFNIKVLSPPIALNHYMNKPSSVENILKSGKGLILKKYVEEQMKEMRQKNDITESNPDERGNIILEQILKRFNINNPQYAEIQKELENEQYDSSYWEVRDKYFENARSLFNDISIVVSIDYDDEDIKKRFLFPGDLSNWSIILAKYSNFIRNRIIKVPHHGTHHLAHDPYIYYQLLNDSYFHFPNLIISQTDLRSIFIQYTNKLKSRLIELPRHSSPLIEPPFRILPPKWDAKNLYSFIKPELSLIYPLKNHKLPNYRVYKKILCSSKRIICMFEPSTKLNEQKNDLESCKDFYNCREREVSVVYIYRTWKEFLQLLCEHLRKKEKEDDISRQNNKLYGIPKSSILSSINFNI